MQIAGIFHFLSAVQWGVGGGGSFIGHGQLEPEEHHIKRVPFKWGICALKKCSKYGLIRVGLC